MAGIDYYLSYPTTVKSFVQHGMSIRLGESLLVNRWFAGKLADINFLTISQLVKKYYKVLLQHPAIAVQGPTRSWRAPSVALARLRWKSSTPKLPGSATMKSLNT